MTQAYQLQNIEYAYDEEVVLDIDGYSIERNVVTALIGANGSGKSTLLNVLAFVTTPSRGELYFFGEKVLNGNVQTLRRQIAYVQQRPYLFNFTVLQNIELGLKLRGVDKKLWHTRVETVVENSKLQNLLQKRAHELSGGEIQKVAIARALVLEPKILILDEPFTHLDSESKADIETLLRDMRDAGSQTIIFSSHDQLQAQNLAEHICVLDKGLVKPCLLLNAFKGEVNTVTSTFNTGKSEIQIPSIIKSGTQIAVDPVHLVLSREELKSSMRNHFQGRVKSLQEAYGEIHVIVEAEESWHAIITHASLHELNINIGEQIWLSFKSSAVQVF
jgi:tungstate transport system ATP-binding protein